jgi:quercetin dioxygenase-like cupin family protein
MPFSSKDFFRTKSHLNYEPPDRLVHRQIASQIHGEFSRERGHGVAIVDLPSHTMSLTIGHLAVGQMTRRHRHNYETILYVTKGQGYSLIEDMKVEWQAGDAVYIPVWAWHNHVNTGATPAQYMACENTPLLQNLGNIALREEVGPSPPHPPEKGPSPAAGCKRETRGAPRGRLIQASKS